MKKTGILLFVAVILGGIGWAGTTYMAGQKTESRYFELLDQYGQWGPVTLSNQGYEKGLLGASAATLVQVAIPTSTEEPQGEGDIRKVELLFEHELQHGPLFLEAPRESGDAPSTGLALIETRLVRLSSEGWEADDLLEKVPELRQALALVTVDFDGSTRTGVQIPAFERQAEDALITWGGLDFTMDWAPGTGELQGELEMPSLVVSAEDGVMTWKGLHGRFDLVEALPALYVGSSEGVFGGMDLNIAGLEEQAMHLEKIEVVSESSFGDGMVQASQTATFDGVTVTGEHYGPLVLDVDLRNLDGQALSDMQIEAREVYRRAGAFNPDEIAAELVPLYTRLFSRLLEGQPEMNIKRLHVATPRGQADGTLQLRLTGMPEMAPEDPAAVLSALQHLDAAFDLAVDESLLRVLLARQMEDALRSVAEASPEADFSEEELAALIDAQIGSQLEIWEGQKYIVRDGDKVKTSAVFREGELTVNGKALPLFGG